MEFENPLFLTLALSGAFFVIAGFYTKKFPPEKINHLYGYRTRSSMRSQERWVFAQKISSRQMIRTGITEIIISLIGLFVQLSTFTAMVTGISILLILIVFMFLKVERAIKREFGEK